GWRVTARRWIAPGRRVAGRGGLEPAGGRQVGPAARTEALRRLRKGRVAMRALGHRRLQMSRLDLRRAGRRAGSPLPRGQPPPYAQSRGVLEAGQDNALHYRAMPRVTAETVDHVARLAHLSLTDQERETFTRQLEQVLAYAESIQALDVSGVEPMSHAAATEVFREDVVREGLPRETALAAAPDADPESGLFRVPRVLGG